MLCWIPNVAKISFNRVDGYSLYCPTLPIKKWFITLGKALLCHNALTSWWLWGYDTYRTSCGHANVGLAQGGHPIRIGVGVDFSISEVNCKSIREEAVLGECVIFGEVDEEDKLSIKLNYHRFWNGLYQYCWACCIAVGRLRIIVTSCDSLWSLKALEATMSSQWSLESIPKILLIGRCLKRYRYCLL